MKKVLLITYHYPPSTAVGAVRPSKLVRYLTAFGWTPIVVAALPAGASHLAGKGGDAGEEGCVIRVPEWPHPLKHYQALRARHLRRRGRLEELQAKASPSYQALQRHPSRLGAWLIPMLSLPDRELGWLAPAAWAGWQQLRTRDIHCVLTSGPPFTCHLVGLLLKRLTHVPWVAEFRDPWSLRHKYPVLRNAMSDTIEARLIRQVMAKADRIVSVTGRMTDEAVKEHPELDPAKFLTIPSGFDPADYAGIPVGRHVPPPVIFAYLGTFYHGRTPEPFLTALRSLLDDGLVRAEDLRVQFLGLVDQAEGRSVAALVAELQLASIVSLHGPVPRPEALRRTLEAHVVLILNERHPTQVPYKLYEALGAGAIILNIGSGGAVADILASVKRGVSVDYRSQAEIRRAILTCLEQSRARRDPQRAPWDDPVLQPFDIRVLSGALAQVLDGLQAPSAA